MRCSKTHLRHLTTARATGNPVPEEIKNDLSPPFWHSARILGGSCLARYHRGLLFTRTISAV